MISKSDNVKYFAPIKCENGVYTVAWDFAEVFDDVYEMKNGKMVATSKVATDRASWKEFTVKHKPTVKEIQEIIYKYINETTEYNICNRFTWNGFNVKLTKTNQLNYKAAYDLAVQTNGMSLPVTFKFSKDNETAYYTFEDVDTLTDFYVGTQNHINNALQNCWKLKDSIIWENYKL